MVEALVARQAKVTVIARDSARLTELKARLGVSIIAGDATDPMLAESVLRNVRPSVLVLNAGATPEMARLHEQTWESFSKNWNTDVKAAFHWIQAALRLPLDRDSRVLISSSGAAIEGSPLSGGYAGAKRMIWLMAGYANGVANDLNLGIRFQALVLRQIVGATELGRAAAEAYARRKGVTNEAFLLDSENRSARAIMASTSRPCSPIPDTRVRRRSVSVAKQEFSRSTREAGGGNGWAARIFSCARPAVRDERTLKI